MIFLDMAILVWVIAFLLSCLLNKTHANSTNKVLKESTKTCFMSTSNMLLLMKAEEELVKHMRSFLEKYKDETISFVIPIKIYIDRYDWMVSKGKNISEIINHPIDVYHIVKDITLGWKDINRTCESNMDCPTGFLGELMKIRSTCNFPEVRHLSLIWMAMARLQHTYQLNVNDMLQGTIIDPLRQIAYQGIYSLNAWDCLKIGIAAQQEALQSVAVKWISAAKELILSGDTSAPLTTCDKYLHYATESAADISQTEDGPLYMDMIQQFQERIRLGKQNYVSRLQSYLSHKDFIFDEDMLCRGQTLMPTVMDWSLHCRYETHGNPYLKMGPFKVEQISADPPIYTFHEFIYESEISKIQEKAIPLMEDSEGFFKQDNGSVIVNTGSRRVSQHTYIGLRDDRVLVSQLLRRAEAAFNMHFLSVIIPPLKVINYGVGGHYRTHLDYGTLMEKVSQWNTGRSIATILFYLSDVEAGGATVFPVTGIAMRPEKGAAILYFNFDKAGEIEHTSYHAGCPVLYGSKWVTSIFPSMDDQMFTTRKCGLHPLDTYDL